MASNVEISRFIQFVSLDTHPANNALVVTYEIVVSVRDPRRSAAGKHGELARRTKRGQLQIHISALDALKPDDLKANKLAINLQELSAEVVRKCPLLLSSAGSHVASHHLEDIQLHLLYLISRRQSQLLTEASSVESGAGHRERPPSSASIRRFRSSSGRPARHSASSRSGSAASARSRTGAPPSSRALDYEPAGGDVYSNLHAKHSAASIESDDWSSLDYFMDQFDQRLVASIEATGEFAAAAAAQMMKTQAGDGHPDLSQLETYLEGLYGDRSEKLVAMEFIRRLSREDECLPHLSSNRLLICALLRTLRDHSDASGPLSESIFFCIIRLTSFEDIYERAFTTDEPIDLVKIFVDLLIEQTGNILQGGPAGSVVVEAAAAQPPQQQPKRHQEQLQAKLLSERYYYIDSVLIVLMNLLKIGDEKFQVEQKILFGGGGSGGGARNKSRPTAAAGTTITSDRQFLGSLVELFRLAARQLAAELRLSSLQSGNSVRLLGRIIAILKHLSPLKEFVGQLRGRQAFVDSAIGLLNTAQLSRPGSGAPQSSGLAAGLSIVTDRETLNELYELEIRLLELLNNLMLDQRIKRKLIKKNLLKCVLRNLVVFLASRKATNTLSPFHRSPVLMVPFKSLYELSCDELVKSELYRSRIIMKCLLEYLLSVTMDLRPALELLAGAGSIDSGGGGDGGRSASGRTSGQSKANDTTNNGRPERRRQRRVAPTGSRGSAGDDPFDQIVIEPDCVGHYIVSLWINLSARKEAAVYGDDLELRELVCEHIELAINNLLAFLFLLRPASVSLTSPPSYRDDSNQSHHLVIVYLHMKLLRNLSQFLEFNSSSEQDTGDGEQPLLLAKWIRRMAEASETLLANASAPGPSLVGTLSAECLAVLNNLIANSGPPAGTTALPSMKCLLERLSLLSAGDFASENDDLLLVSVIFVGTLARSREVCDETSPKVQTKLLEASNFILESRQTDHEMIINSLYTLSQLMNHSSFLEELSAHCGDGDIGGSVGRLVDRLASLMLDGDQALARLASRLLNCFRQLEEQRTIDESPLVYKKRFASYNAKWLLAIGGSRGALTGGDDGDFDRQRARPFGILTGGDDGEEDNDEYDDDDDDDLDVIDDVFGEDEGAGLNHLRAVGEEPTRSGGGRGSGIEDDDDYGDVDDEYDDVDDDDDQNETSLVDGPDLNVIDANSMIKHLTSRRELRGAQLEASWGPNVAPSSNN